MMMAKANPDTNTSQIDNELVNEIDDEVKLLRVEINDLTLIVDGLKRSSGGSPNLSPPSHGRGRSGSRA